MHRFFVDDASGQPLAVGQRVILDPAESAHLATVLRTGPGALLVLTDGRGHVFEGVLVDRNKRCCVVRITAARNDESETAAPRLHLACAVVKGRRFEVALEKATELGAHVITPLLTEHGVVEPGPGKVDRWRSLLVAALKQSDRSLLPRLQPPGRFADVLDAAVAAGSEIWFGAAPIETPSTAPLTMLQAAGLVAKMQCENPAVPDEMLLLIGPEGGWSPAEQELFARHGARSLTFGPHVLRTETAAMAGMTILQQLRAIWSSGPALLDLPP